VYIRQLRIDQFGACADFEIGSLAPGLTMIHGPRGAGKSTIAAFVQGALFGYDTPLAARFLEHRFLEHRFVTDRGPSTWSGQRKPARDHEAQNTRQRPEPLGGSLSLTLSSAPDRARDTRLIERHHNGDVERLRLSRLVVERDPRWSGDEREEIAVQPLDPAAIETLYAGLPAHFLSDLFVLDFERTTRLGALLEQAERYSGPLVESIANRARVQELEGELAAAREQRSALADPGASSETLAARRRQLLDEIDELESRSRRQQGERARWRQDHATLAASLERQLATHNRDIETLDAAIATLVERRRQLAAAATRSTLATDSRDPAVREAALRDPAAREAAVREAALRDPAVRDELQKLDEQLERWRRTLGELITAKGHAAELAEASDRMLANGTATEALGLLRRSPSVLFGLDDAELAGLPAGDPLRRLAELEASTFAIAELLAKTQSLLRDHAPPLLANELSESLERHHQVLRSQTRQLAESLAGWRHWITKRAAADEQQQLLRSEIEFRRAIAALEERRQKLLGRAADPVAMTAAARTDTLDECQRLMERRESALRRRQETARQLAEIQRLLVEFEATSGVSPELRDSGDRDWRSRLHASSSMNVELETRSVSVAEADEEAAAIERQLRDLRSRAVRGSFEPIGPAGLAGPADNRIAETLFSQIEAKRSQLAQLERDIAMAERRRELARQCDELERQLDEQRARRSPHPVLIEASEFLAQVTDGRLPRIARDVQGRLRVETASGERLDWETLTEAAQDQVALAMHVALAREFRRRGVQLPLVINEPFARYADRELPAAVRGLQRLADQVQILCFTGDERAARAARIAGVALGWLRVDADGRPAAFDSSHVAADASARPAAADRPLVASFETASSRPASAAAAASVAAAAAAASPPQQNEFSAPRASWGVRRPHAWDAEEFPGELADRRRFAAATRSPQATDGHESGRFAAAASEAGKLEAGKLEAGKLEAGKLEAGKLEAGKLEAGKFAAGKFEAGSLESAESTAPESPPRYLLNRAELAAHAPSISGLVAQRLEDRGVRTVGDLLAVNADTLALLLGDVSAKAIRGWQTQAELACRVPGLRATDCRILAALQIGSVEKLAALKPAELWKRVSHATDSGDWDRIAPGVAPPDPATISNWIHAARRARSLAAA
jgi:hypothetical protein